MLLMFAEITYSFKYVDTCIVKCCIEHGLPTDCMHEESKSMKISKLNSTHQDVTMVLSDNCAKYSSILHDCKSTCLESRKGNE